MNAKERRADENSVLEISLRNLANRVDDESIKRWSSEERKALLTLVAREHRLHLKECILCRWDDTYCEFSQAQRRFLGLKEKKDHA